MDILFLTYLCLFFILTIFLNSKSEEKIVRPAIMDPEAQDLIEKSPSVQNKRTSNVRRKLICLIIYYLRRSH